MSRGKGFFAGFIIALLAFQSGIFAQGDNARYDQVKSKLDERGSLFLYIDLKDRFRDLFNTAKTSILQLEEGEDARKMFSVAESVLQSLGVFSIEDVGLSSAKTGDLYRMKILLRMPDENKTLINILGGDPHPFDAAGKVPADTVILRSFDLNVNALYELIRKVVDETGGSILLDEMDKAILDMGTALNLNIDRLLRNFGNTWTLFVALDEKKTMDIPGIEPPLAIPMPKIGLSIETKDNYLYDSLSTIFTTPEVTEKTADGQEIKIKEIPAPPDEKILLTPRMIRQGNQLIFISDSELLNVVLGRTPESPSLKDKKDFQRLTGGIPMEGNDLAYLSPRLWATISAALKEIVQRDPNGAEPLSVLLGLFDNSALTRGIAAARINQPDGIYIIANSEGDLGMASLLSGSTQIFGGLFGLIAGGDDSKETAEVEADDSDKTTDSEADEEDADEESDSDSGAVEDTSAEDEDDVQAIEDIQPDAVQIDEQN